MAGEKRAWIYDLLLIVVLLGAAYFRLTGLAWDETQHLHPDERFLTMVETSLEPVKSLGEYFDTATSSLNPHNRGYGFYVYGDLPLLIVRYLAQWLNQTGYDQVNIVGRQVSAAADLGVIFLLYLIASRLYGRRVGLLAAAFSALTVMQIQQSHFFTTDNPANFFAYLALLFAVLIAGDRPPAAAPSQSLPNEASGADAPRETTLGSVLRDRLLWLSLGFGLAFGLAAASKLNIAPMAILLPAAFGARYLQCRGDPHTPAPGVERLLVCLVAGGLVAVVAFRIFQPYAFIGLRLNPAWLDNIRELQAQSNGDADVPFALQWARRSHFFSFKNLTLWGFGLPLGILAWAGFAWMAWRLFKREWKHALLWGWTALYFGWQSMAFNPNMRYQLPIYPLLAMMAAWLVFNPPSLKRLRLKPVALGVGAIVLLLTAAWAFAFTRIYTRPHTRVAATHWIYQNLPGPITPGIQTPAGTVHQPLPFPYENTLEPDAPFTAAFSATASGTLNEVTLPHVRTTAAEAGVVTLDLTLTSDDPASPPLAFASLAGDFPSGADGRGGSYTLALTPPVNVEQGRTYFLQLESSGSLALQGAAPINESSWDDGLPLRMDGYDGFGGLYNGNLNLELYFDDNPDKLQRFVSTLTQGDYIFISSNRQWATVTRVPERYPLTTRYYRLLIGCPDGRDVIWCYNVAEPGQFQGQLGYELVNVFESFPTLEIPGLFKWQANDQFAEEAFTVYDHPKVLIFKKSASYSQEQVQALLGAVDLSNVIHLTPREAGSYKANTKDLNLPPDRLAQQRAGGTWSQLFSYDWVQNHYPYFGLLIWYGFIFLLGLFTFPLARLALPGLGAGAYGVSRLLGMALLAWFSWMGGSAGLTYSRGTIALAFGLVVALGLVLGWRQRRELRAQWDSDRRLFLLIEILFLAFFLFDLFIRIGNPDLWHPAKGGERPMDFSYFNAVLKSSSFPPYDPWFAGGYINYYYYGFVLVGTPVKLLGIVPSIAYNMILPTLFAMVGVGAFTVVSRLVAGTLRDPGGRPFPLNIPLVSGIAAGLLTVVLGNLGTVRMLYQGFQKMAAPDGNIDIANVFQRWFWAIKGFALALTGTPLPFGPGDWYWNPSRVIPAPGDVEPINEFPFFTFLYSDLHAHMIVLPLALFALAWVVSFIKTRARMKPAEWTASLLAGGLVLGAIYPTNLSDIYTYLLIAVAAMGFILWFRADLSGLRLPITLPDIWRKLIVIAASVGALWLLSDLLYEPYRFWYGQAYGAVDPWKGTHTPLWSYLTHWGLFLFVIVFWMAWETRQWMAAVPASRLKSLRPYAFLMEGALAVVLAALVYFGLKGVQIGWLAFLLAAWAGILLLRGDLADEKRLVLFLTGTALLITIVVELVVVRGDIGRMNTVFKFYLQAWVLLSVSAAAAFGWLLSELDLWRARWRGLFQTGLYILTAGAFLYTLTASSDKMTDRVAPQAPHTLDSMTYMDYAMYWEEADMDLSQDYHAIRWMQDHVQGSPVIVEMNVPEYRWGTRYTIYTGLPGVVGWNFHQRQQRALLPSTVVTDRVDQVGIFYGTQDVDDALAFLKRYDVRYIIVGQLERIIAPQGMAKFEDYNNIYWHVVYHADQTTIYEVNP